MRLRAALGLAIIAFFGAGCSGGGGSPVARVTASPIGEPTPIPSTSPSAHPSASPSATPTASPTPSPAPTPIATPTPAGLVDWPTFGYNAQRTGESPDTTITSANVGNLKLVWAHQGDLNGGNEFNLETQPVVATNVSAGGTARDLVYIGGGSGNVYAFDAHTGVTVWTQSLPPGSYSCNGQVGPFGVQGTFALDRANGVIYVPDGVHKIHALDLATGADRWSVDAVAPGTDDGADTELRAFVHTGLNLVNGKLYAGTSGVCDLTPWRGRVAVIDVASHTLQSTYFTAANFAPPGSFFSGGGVWGWGGVSAEPDGSIVYTGVGNADTSAQNAPFVQASNETAGYAEHIVSFKGDLTSALDSHAPSLTFSSNPLNAVDIDLSGTPVLFQPPGCPPLLAVQGKEGFIFIYNRANLSGGPIFEGQYSISSDDAYFMGLPAYSRQTGYLYTSVPTGGSLSGLPPGLAIIQPNAGCTGFSVVASAGFGPDSTDAVFQYGENPRSAPTVVNDVVFVGTPDGVLWARNAKTAAPLWDSVSGGAWASQPLGDEIRFGPVVDGGMVFVVETESASIYALTVNGSTPASARRAYLAAGRTALPAAPVRHRYRRHRHPF